MKEMKESDQVTFRKRVIDKECNKTNLGSEEERGSLVYFLVPSSRDDLMSF